MGRSRGEIKISEILQKSGLNFEEEFSFSDLTTTTGRPLRFDFAVFDDEGNLEFLIEFQGKQHYEARGKFGGKSGFAKQRYNDTRKRVYCYQRNIPLIAIPYWDEARVDFDYIMKAAGY
jgi:hypothetical protein